MLEFPFLIIAILRFFVSLLTLKFKHVTSTYIHNWIFCVCFTSKVTYFHKVIDISCMRSFLEYQTLHIIFDAYVHDNY